MVPNKVKRYSPTFLIGWEYPVAFLQHISSRPEVRRFGAIHKGLLIITTEVTKYNKTQINK